MKRFEATKYVIDELSKVLDSDEAISEGQWLVAMSLGINRSSVLTRDEVSFLEFEKISSALKLRLERMPLAYIFNSANFYGLEFYVNEHVLVPRPETEELVEEFLKNDFKKTDRVLDIGTGSGAIAVVVAKLAQCLVTAVDISEQALTVAKKNAVINEVEVEFVYSDLFLNLNGRKFDYIISNPPYINEDEYNKLDDEVVKFEPKLALVGGKDGLDFYRKIISDAPKYLSSCGKIYFEIGYDQATEVTRLLCKDFEDIVVKKDISGKDRIVIAKLKS